MCLKFPEFEAGCAYKLIVYKKTHVYVGFVFASHLISRLWSNPWLPLHRRHVRRQRPEVVR